MPKSGSDSPEEQGSLPQVEASALLEWTDLTELARAGKLEPAVRCPSPESIGSSSTERDHWQRPLEGIARGLFRRHGGHVLVIGRRGVGRTTLIRELARCVAAGQYPFLQNHRFLWTDCSAVLPETSRWHLTAILNATHVAPDTVFCLDGFGALLGGPGAANHKSLLRSLLAQAQGRLVGILSPWEYDELFASEAELLERFSRVVVDEPDEETTQAIVQQVAHRLEQTFNANFERSAVERAVVLSGRHVWNDCWPAKAVKVLQRACEDRQFDETQCGQAGEGRSLTVAVSDVLRALSEVSRIPVETLAGEFDGTDVEAMLRQAVIGQEPAVKQVALELRLIKAGLTDPGKPASVFLFCGLNGVGKTELAKRVASLYSATKRLQVYTMGNFVEAHSVSGLIGVPAGYVGHDRGGPLINDLLSDPYGVFLLDEIEKAHPDVLKPLLNLFDEGWIVDQRGVRAYADRAIFIMTSNAGADAIAQMSRSGKSHEEIIEQVKTTLARVRNERSSQPVLSQAFLSRIRKIVVFQSLDAAAFSQIVDKCVADLDQQFLKLRGTRLELTPTMIEEIAAAAKLANERSGGREGARLIRGLVLERMATVLPQETLL